MQTTVHYYFTSKKAQGGFMPSCWLAIDSNDRTPEITLGSLEERVT